MLRSLRVRDLATVADVTLELGPGLNILTGETGAGKSILVDALALLLGDRADRAAVRPGASRLSVDGEFDDLTPVVDELLCELGLDVSESLIIRREVSNNGRSRAWINGSPTTIGILARIGSLLVDLHGQHQTVALADAPRQRSLLDRYADTGVVLTAVATAHATVAARRQQLAELTQRRDEVLRRSDWLRHVVNEIDAADLRIGEDAELDGEAQRLAQVGSLGELAQEANQALDDDEVGVRAVLSRISKTVESLSRLDPAVAEWKELINNAWAGLDELSRRVADYRETLSEDPDRLTAIERRRATIGDLVRKHGNSIEEVLDVRRDSAAELELLDTVELDMRGLQSDLTDNQSTLEAAATELSKLRRNAAARLAGEVSRILPRLSLKEAAFEVSLQPMSEASATGAESIEFVARLNPGMSMQSVANVASGGELSRLMLAIKVVLARHDDTPTLVFDEIDQGIGGETGGQVGAALEEVSGRHQVLVITHLPQIAARGDRHLLIAKGTRAGVATSDVATLHGEDRMLEIARMLGGGDDPNARRLALSMLAKISQA
jgi:DNA repair protein RecN (Recombination protein N)